ncbi:MAG TPA: sulfur carrier protein ThiS [Clostridiaceae bacterium]
MKIKVNGKEVILEKEINVKDLLIVLKVATPEYVTVQINEEFVDTEDLEKVIIKEGDSVEFLYFMGGGQ